MGGTVGEAGIFTFPYRMYLGEEIAPFELADIDGLHSVRVYSPWAVRHAGAPLSPHPPFADWPDFSWSPNLPADKCLEPPAKTWGTPPQAPAFADALRVDVLGPGSGALLQSFTSGFVRWLRHLSLQPWVGEYEPQSDWHLKFGFECDSEGRATDTPYAYGMFTTFARWMRLIDNEIWREAIHRALNSQEPNVYWDVFMDSQMQRAATKKSAALLSLTLAVEIARDRNFRRFAPTQSRPGIGTVLGRPFHGTDLLKHLSSSLEAVTSRNLKKERPLEWADLNQLYVARHHIAHGGPAVLPDKTGLHPARKADVRRLTESVYAIIRWIEDL